MRMMQHRSFQRKLLYGFLLTGAAPLIICVVLLLGIFQAELARNAQDSALTGLSTASENLDQLLGDCAETMSALRQHPMIAATLNADDAVTPQGIYDTLYGLPQKLRGQADFSLFERNGKRLYTTALSSGQATLPTQWGLLRAARAQQDIVFLRGETTAGASLLQAACTIQKEGELLGYVVMTMSREQMSQLLEHWQEPSGGLLLLDAYWGELWSSRSVLGEQTAVLLRQRLLAGLTLSDKDTSSYYVSRSPLSGFFLVAQQPAPVARWVMQLLWLVAGLAIVICFGLCVAVSMRLSRHLFAPIHALNHAMGQVEDGNLEVRLSITGADEMAQLSGRFNRMADRLSANLADSLRRQKELNEARIRMMQAQLNPHFLYNTLDTVKWLGKINNISEIAAIASDLADMLRFGISGRELVPLSEELGLLSRYVEIQTIRFPGKFRLVTEVDPAVTDTPVPRLMLQPLVENAILHGFSNMEDGLILLSAERVGQTLSVTVRDNGQGVSEQLLRRLETQTSAEQGHLGLYNVREILRLHFGSEYGLRFVPVKEGTCIRIILPLSGKGDSK